MTGLHKFREFFGYGIFTISEPCLKIKYKIKMLILKINKKQHFYGVYKLKSKLKHEFFMLNNIFKL